jgi:hypothetical protein
MLQLMGGTLMLGQRGMMVVMGNGLCVYLCVHAETTKNKEESEIMNRLVLDFFGLQTARPQVC